MTTVDGCHTLREANEALYLGGLFPSGRVDRGARMCGIIFDVDGVIADTEAVNAEASIKMFRELFNLPNVRRGDFAEGVGRGAEAYVQAAARRHGRELTPEEINEATRIRQENFLAILRERPLPPFPGVMDLIAGALEASRDGSSHRAFRLAIATSSTREKSMAVLKAAGIPVDRMAYVCGDDVTRKKPDPELFVTAAERLGLPPEACVVVEDAPDGVEAARAAGMKCIAVTNSFAREMLSRADLVVASLTEVSLERIERLPTLHSYGDGAMFEGA